MPEFLPFERILSISWDPNVWRDVTVLVAVSGGADSVALLRGLTAVRREGPGNLVVAHFNHGLRGTESDEDEAFVAQICRQLDVDCQVGRPIDSNTQSVTVGSEEAAREARYAFFRCTAEDVGARYVVMAHTADDQAETVLHRILRGTGVSGLAGIPRSRELLPGVSLIRPLLAVRRVEVIDYLQAVQQPFRVDETNRDGRFTRNRIRHGLLPQLVDEYNANVVEAINRLGRLAGETQQVIDWMAADLMKRCATAESAHAVTIDCRSLQTQHRHLVCETLIAIWRRQSWPLQSMSQERWTELADLVKLEPSAPKAPKQLFPGGIMAQRHGEILTLRVEAKGPRVACD